MIKHKENCLSINGKQSVKLEKGIIEFENYFKQIPVPFKIYADFECNLKSVESYEGSYSKKYQDHVPCSFAYKLVRVDDEFIIPIFVLEVNILLLNLLKQFLKSMSTVKTMKKHFNKNLVMSEEEEQFQSSNICCIDEKLIDYDHVKVGDHCHITGKFRGAAPWSCNKSSID